MCIRDRPEHQIMLDEAEGWGYSCLTMIDKETIGILYESSVAPVSYTHLAKYIFIRLKGVFLNTLSGTL